MPDRAALLAEAQRRGILPPSLQGEYDQLKTSGRIPATIGTKAGNTQFDNTSQLRKEFIGRPEVQNFTTILPQVSTAMKLANNPKATGADDLNIIYTFGKVMDPGSVVREGELALASDTGSFAQTLEGAIEKIKAGDRLPVAVRRNLVESMRRRGIEMAKAYNQTRDNYKGLATRAGIAPEDVIGLHPAEPFQQAEADFSHQVIRNRDQSVGATPAGMKPQAPTIAPSPVPAAPREGHDIEWGAGAEETAHGPRFTPEQEQDMQAFLKSKPNAKQIMARADSYGGGITIAAPEAQKLADFYGKGGSGSAFDYSKPDAEAMKGTLALKAAQDRMKGPGGAQDLIMKGASFNLNDEAAGVAHAGMNIAESPFTGDFNPGRAYVEGRDSIRLRTQDARKNYGPYASTALEIGGGLLGLRPSVGSVAPLTTMGTVKAGAIGGGVAGFGNGEGAQDSLGQAAVGAGLGASLGLAAPYVVTGAKKAVTGLNSVYGAIPSVAARQAERATLAETAGGVIDAGKALGVPVTRPMIDPYIRNKVAALEVKPGSAPVIQKGFQATTDALEREALKLGQGADSASTEAAGQAVQEAGRRFIKRSRVVKDKLYTKAEELSAGAKVNPETALAEIKRNIAELTDIGAASNAGQIKYLKELAADLSKDGGVSVASIRGLRTNMRGQINERTLTHTDAERRVGQVLDAASDDLTAALQKNNPGAATAYAAADKLYRQRSTYIKDVLQKFMGRQDAPISGEAAFAKLKAMANPGNGDARRLSEMYKALEPEERGTIAATMAESLGRRAPDEPFSAALLVSQARKLSPAARRTIFGDEGAKAIDNLTLLATHQRDALGALNKSRTGVTNSYGGELVRGLMGAGMGAGAGSATGSTTATLAGAALGAGTEVARVVSRNISARALMSQRFVRWIEAAPKGDSPTAIANHVRQLTAIASAEPAIAGEVKALQTKLIEALNASPAPAAGKDKQNGRPPIPEHYSQ